MTWQNVVHLYTNSNLLFHSLTFNKGWGITLLISGIWRVGKCIGSSNCGWYTRVLYASVIILGCILLIFLLFYLILIREATGITSLFYYILMRLGSIHFGLKVNIQNIPSLAINPKLLIYCLNDISVQNIAVVLNFLGLQATDII
jgi:hypothetical protein